MCQKNIRYSNKNNKNEKNKKNKKNEEEYKIWE